ncbi:MAG TPA: hypothetical protein VJL29_01675 [Thermoguttaceae bacterium]|nr:hypothetical protein [Thermoguttaceae bacterium]
MPADATDRWLPDAVKVKVDDAAALAAGIRKLEGRHVIFYTDLPADEQTDALPAVFDQAIPQWARYFGIDPQKAAEWRLTGFLIKDAEPFRRLGLLPADLPPFQHGFSRNTDFWIHEQPSDYALRHLVLHEGTHCFMNSFLGACGPPWFMEGTAELLATHRLTDEGHLELNRMPRARNEVPMWGRIKLVKDAVAAGRGRSLREVLDYRYQVFLETEPYAWSWAAAMFLDRHPKYGELFRRLRGDVLRPYLTKQFIAAVGDEWTALEQQWAVFLDELDYGCDVAATLVDVAPGKPLDPAGVHVSISARHGWQNSGVRVEQGKKYHLRAEGRYQVADRPKIWWCEPGGVTIRYSRGRPLGMLLATVLPDSTSTGDRSIVPEAIAVGLEATVKPTRSGTLYLRINESSAELGDNAGEVEVEIGLE